MAGFILPTGGDRADGVTNLPAQPIGSSGSGKVGTPTPAGALAIKSNSPLNTWTEEETDSPEFERAEQATFLHRLNMDYKSALTMLSNLPRGTFVKDSFSNVWRILSSKIQSKRGTNASLSYTAESISFDSPPDEFSCQAVDLGLDIIKHPRYSWALLPYQYDTQSYATFGDTNTKIYFSDIKSQIVRLIQNYQDAPIYPSNFSVANGYVHENILQSLGSGTIDVNIPNPNGYQPPSGSTTVPTPPTWDGNAATKAALGKTSRYVTVVINLYNCNGKNLLSSPTSPIAIAIAAAQELISKIWRGETTPYLTGYRISWSQYYFVPVLLNPGGYIENPVGVVPDYFMSPSQTGRDTIFDALPFVNPQSYSQNRLIGGDLII
jgi:hypothetical protein